MWTNTNVRWLAAVPPERCHIHCTAASTQRRSSVPHSGTCSSPCRRPSASAPSPSTHARGERSSAASDVSAPSTCLAPTRYRQNGWSNDNGVRLVKPHVAQVIFFGFRNPLTTILIRHMKFSVDIIFGQKKLMGSSLKSGVCSATECIYGCMSKTCVITSTSPCSKL